MITQAAQIDSCLRSLSVSLPSGHAPEAALRESSGGVLAVFSASSKCQYREQHDVRQAEDEPEVDVRLCINLREAFQACGCGKE